MIGPKTSYVNGDKTNTLHGIFYSSNSTSVEKFLTQMHSYIINVVTKEMRRNSFGVHPALLDLEIDEVIQCIRIKFWQAGKRDILRSQKPI